MRKDLCMRTSLKTIISILLCLCLTGGAIVLFDSPTKASVALSANATVSGETVTVTVTFPDVTLASVSVDVAFNTAHLKMSAEATHTVPAGPMAMPSPSATANSQGKCTLAVAGMTDISFNGVTLTLVFHVESTEVESTNVTVTVTKATKADTSPVSLEGATKEITLKTVTPPPPPPPPSSDESDSSVSSSVTDEGGDSDVSDTPKPPVSSVTSSKPTSSVTSSKVPSDSQTTDTGTVTDLPEVSDTESILSSSESDAITDLPVTDTSDSDLSQTSDTNTSSNPTSVPLGTQVVRTEGNGGSGMSTDTVVLLVSIAAACFLCFCLTYLGLRRQTPKNPEEE